MRLAWARPAWMFAGLLITTAIFAVVGHGLSRRTHLDHFVRFFPPLQPQLQYFVSPAQVVNTIERSYQPGRVIVIVGGSSIFRGVGQNVSELWTRQLQRELGDRFQVFNVAIDQQTMEGFGSVVFRIIKHRHPATIYVGSSSTEQIGQMDGIPIYRYFFWDAYYSGALKLDEEDSRVASGLRRRELLNGDGRGVHVASWLENILRFRETFNAVAYRLVFPMFVANTGADWYLPRNDYKDLDTDWQQVQAQVRGDAQRRKQVVDRLRVVARRGNLTSSPDGAPTIHAAIRNSLEAAFSRRLRPAIVAVLTVPNPEYLRDLSPEDRSSLWSHYDQALSIHRALGYRTELVGADFVPDDFVDQGHFSSAGGRKLADRVAPEVRAAAEDLGFFKSSQSTSANDPQNAT